MKSYSCLKVLLEILHFRVYRLLDINLVIFLVGLGKFDPLLASIQCLKIIFLYVMIVHSECGGWLIYLWL